MDYKDSNGNPYTFNADAASVIRAEHRTGEAILSGMFRASETGDAIEAAENLFSRTDKLMATLYECSVDPEKQDALPFEKFCKGFQYGFAFELGVKIIDILFESFAPPGGPIAPEGEDADAGKASADPGQSATSTT